MLRCYIAHQRDVIVRRTRFELAKAEARKHILEGLRIALDNLDEVVRTIRASSGRDDARTQLMARFDFSELQANARFRELQANAEIARSVGVPEVAVCEDGDVVVLEDGEMRVDRGAVSSGYVYVDGLEVGEDEGVLRDRRHLADDGVILVTNHKSVDYGLVAEHANVRSGLLLVEGPGFRFKGASGVAVESSGIALSTAGMRSTRWWYATPAIRRAPWFSG